MIVTEYLNTDAPLEFSEEELHQLKELEQLPIVYDEDCPPLTAEQIARFTALYQAKKRVAV